MDTVVGWFEDPARAERAVAELVEKGYSADRVGTRWTIAADWRGLEGGEAPHGARHDPVVGPRDPASATGLLVTVSVDDDDPEELVGLLRSLGAAEVEVAHGVPPGTYEP